MLENLNNNALNLKTEIETRLYALLPKAIVKIEKDNLLTITINLPSEEISDLRTKFANLQTEYFVGIRIKFTITKVKVRNSNGKYEMADLDKPKEIETILSLNHFHVNRIEKWTNKNGIVQEATTNKFQISFYLNSVKKKTVISLED